MDGTISTSGTTITNPDVNRKQSNNDNSMNISKHDARKKFRDTWLDDPIFGTWIKRCDGDPYKAKCIACNKTLLAIEYSLHRHNRRAMHKRNIRLKVETGELLQLCTTSLKEDVKMKELRFVLELVEHNRSFKSHKDSDKLILNTKKISAIIKNVFNASIVLRATEVLKNKFLSIMIHDSRYDINEKNLCILAQYVHNSTVQTYLLGYFRFQNLKAENLYRCLMYSLEKHNLSLKNVVGICANNMEVMIGKRNSLVSRLLENNSEVAVLPDIYNSMHLIVSHAIDQLPEGIEIFLQEIATYIPASPKSQSNLKATQKFMKIAKCKVLRPTITKWIALTDCIQRILDEWTVLYNIFAELSTETKCYKARKIFHYFNCQYIKAYLEFLQYILPTFTILNTISKNSQILLHQLLPECVRFLKVLGGHFVKSELLLAEDFYKIDIFDENSTVPLESIVIGIQATTLIKEIRKSSDSFGNEKIVQFYKCCRSFYQEAFKQCVLQFSLNQPFLHSLNFLHPNVALQLGKPTDQVQYVLNKFKSHFNNSAVIDEWQLLSIYFSNEEKENFRKLSITQFWNEVGEIKYSDMSADYYMFANIAQLAKLCLTLSYSNADMEILFSTINDIKSKRRNGWKPDMMAALCRLKLDFKNSNRNCYNYDIDEQMLNLFNSKIYVKAPAPDGVL